MMKNKCLVSERHQINLWQGVLLFFVICLASVGFAIGQTGDERKLELVVQTGHSSFVNSVAFSPNGKILASSGEDGTIILWSVETEEQIKSLEGHTDSVDSVAFSPDGKMLASAGSDKTIKFWNLQTGQQIKSFVGQTSEFKSVSQKVEFSPDGKVLVSVNEDGIKLWNVEMAQLIKSFEKASSIWSVAFSPNGKILVSGNKDGVKLWEIGSGRQIKSLEGHSKVVTSVAFSPNGKTIASGSWDKTIKLWNVETGLQTKSLEGHIASVESVTFSPDGKILASSSRDLTIKLWNAETGELIKSLEANNFRALIAFSADSKNIASSVGPSIKLWNIETGQPIKSFESRVARVRSAAFSPDNKTIGLIEGYGIKLWNVETGQQIKLSEVGVYNQRIVFSPNEKIIASSGQGSEITLWSVETGQQIKSFESNGYDTAFAVAFSPDGKTLASASLKGIKFWDVSTGKQTKFLEDGSVYTVVFSPDGKTLASGDHKRTFKLWNVETGQKIKSFEGHTDWVWSVAFSPDSKILASASWDKTIKLWDTETGQELKSFKGHTDWVYSVAFSPDGKMLASGGADKTIKLWKVETGEQIKSLNAHNGSIYSVEFSPDGRFFISGSGDATTKLWNKENNKPLVTLTSLNKDDWIAIDEEGRFDASEGALKLMHYSYGLEVIDLEQLKEAYYEPGLLQKLLGYSKEPLRSIVPLKDVKLHPEIVEQKFDEKLGKLNLKLKNRGGGIGKTEVYLNGKLMVADARDAKLIQNPNVPIDSIVSLSVDLKNASFVKGKENQIKVITSNYLKEIGKGNIQSRGSEVVYLDQGQAELALPNFYAIVGGVSDYTGEGLDLRFAAKDAEDFSNALRLGANRLFCPSNKPECFGKINITTLSTARQNPNEQPTKENFKKAFAEIAKKAKPEDILVVYLSGHGITLGTGTDTYFYLTKEARWTAKTDLETTFQTVAISNAELIDWLTPNDKNPNDIFVKTLKQVIILDTCAAGNFAKDDEWKKDKDGLTGDQIRAMEFLKDKAGTFIMMGSAANRPSYEANRFNQGLLTYALLEGMQGRALQKPTDNIDVRILFDYAEKRVPELAKEMTLDQRPIIKQPSGNTFLIGQMTDAEKTKITLPQPKPLLLRPVLGVPPINNDPLKLIPELRKRLDAESSYALVQRSGKGEPSLIYVDDDNFPGGWRITGQYKIEGEKVTVEAFLVSDEKTITLGKITADKDKILDELLKVVREELSKLN